MPIDKLLQGEVSVPRAIAQVLEEAGIDLVFGIPVVGRAAIFDALYDSRDSIRTVLVREEGLAAVMADVYGRLTGKPGVAIGQGAFLLTKPGWASSKRSSRARRYCCCPTSATARPSRTTVRTSPAPAMMAPGTRNDHRRLHRAGVCGARRRPGRAGHPARDQARARRPGPVAVLYHGGALSASVGPIPRPALRHRRYMTERTSAVGAALQAAAQRLRTASRPVIVAGNGVRMSSAQAALRRAGGSARGAGGHDGIRAGACLTRRIRWRSACSAPSVSRRPTKWWPRRI